MSERDYVLERLKALEERGPLKPPWWAPAAIGVIIMLLAGWASTLQMAINDLRSDLKRVSDTQRERMHVEPDIKRLEDRAGRVEDLMPRVSGLEAQWRERSALIDRTLELMRDMKSTLDVLSVQQIALREGLRRVEDRVERNQTPAKK